MGFVIVTQHKKKHQFQCVVDIDTIFRKEEKEQKERGTKETFSSDALFKDEKNFIFKDSRMFLTTDQHLVVCHDGSICKQRVSFSDDEKIWTFTYPPFQKGEKEYRPGLFVFLSDVIELGDQNILVCLSFGVCPPSKGHENDWERNERLDTTFLEGFILDFTTGTVVSTFFMDSKWVGPSECVAFGPAHFMIKGSRSKKQDIFTNQGQLVQTTDRFDHSSILSVFNHEYLLMGSAMFTVDPFDLIHPSFLVDFGGLGYPLPPVGERGVAWDADTSVIVFFRKNSLPSWHNENTILVFSVKEKTLLYAGSCGNVVITDIFFHSSSFGVKAKQILVHHKKSLDQNIYSFSQIFF